MSRRWSRTVRGRWSRGLRAAGLALVLAGCGGSAAMTTAASSGSALAPAATARFVHWDTFVPARRPVDVAGPRRDGAIVLAAAGRLALLRPDGTITPYATRYRNSVGEEPYIALASRGCFGRDTAYAIRLGAGKGVLRVGNDGRTQVLARLTARGLVDGIAFDRTGAFGGRLLVTVNAGSGSTVDAIDCHGRVTAITSHAPRIEGGIVVAPRGFGAFGGDLIAPDERGGNLYAITPGGQTRLIGASGLPHGPDIGVESAGFVPRGIVDALLADRLTPGNPHPGDDVVLRIRHAALAAAGVRAGDLLVASEGGARTDAVRCRAAAGCTIRHISDGPSVTHAEGHIAFIAGR